MLDAAGFFERGLHDGLADYERDILRHWDAGAPIKDIVRQTGHRARTVQQVVERYDDRPDIGGEDLAACNARFVAALDAAARRRCRMSAGGPILTVEAIEDMLKDRCDQVFREVFPNAVQRGPELCIGSLAGEPGQSLRMHIGSGTRRGWWRDFSDDRHKGDVLNLIRDAMFNGDKGKAVQWAKSFLRLDDADPARLEQHRLEVAARSEARAKQAAEEVRKAANGAQRRWQQALPLADGDPVCRYLASRSIDLKALAAANGGRGPGALRYHPALQYGFPADGEPAVKAPAMVAMVTRLDGSHVATHRTWLKPDGSGKAGPDQLGYDDRGDPNDPKKVMGRSSGGHIPLWKGDFKGPLRDVPEGTDVYVSEGIEDGLTAACADPSIRVICMIAVGNLAPLELPPQMGRLIILKQNDAPDSNAARTLRRAVASHRAAGRRVFFVEVPGHVKDLNDLACGVGR